MKTNKMRDQDKNRKRKPNIPENNPSKAMDSKKEVEQSPDERTDEDFPGYPHYPAKEDIMDQRTDSRRVDMDLENMASSRNRTGVSQRFVTENEAENREGASGESDAGEDFQDINPRSDYKGPEASAAGEESVIHSEIAVPQNVEEAASELKRQSPDRRDEDRGDRRDRDADVTPEERAALQNMFMPTRDEENLGRSGLDTTDFDGEQLNEDGFGEVLSGTDLDIPDEQDETTSTSLGQGDEENKYYSLGGDRQDQNEEDPYSGPRSGSEL